jgi:uncharacterized protein
MMVRVKVMPRSAKSEVVGTMADGTLKVRVAAPPEKGKANAAVCTVLAAHYGVAASAVTIVSGQTATIKLVRVVGPRF